MPKPFIPTLLNRDKAVNVRFNTRFCDEDWVKFRPFYQGCLKDGYLDWNLDLCEMTFINSMMLGLVIELNAAVLTRGGKLKMTIKRESKVAQLLLLSKINRIIPLFQV